MILDTNALSAFFDGDVGLHQLIVSVHRLSLPVIVLGEYRYGLMHSRDRRRIESRLARLVSVSSVLPVDSDTIAPYAEIRSELRRAGTPLPSNDVWIAALARQHVLPVVSRDAHFDVISGLTRTSW